MKKFILSSIIILLFLILSALVALHNIPSEKIKGFLESEVTKHFGYSLKIGSLDVRVKDKIYLKFDNIKLYNNSLLDKKSKLTLKSGALSLNIFPLLVGIVEFDNVSAKDIELKYDYYKDQSGKNIDRGKESKDLHPKKGIERYFKPPFVITSKNINLENLNFNIKIDNNSAQLEVPEFKIQNFSLKDKFQITVKSYLTINGERGEVVGKGDINIKDSFLNIDVKGKNLGLNIIKTENLKLGNTSFECKIDNIDNKFVLRIKDIQLKLLDEGFIPINDIKISSKITPKDWRIYFNDINLEIDSQMIFSGEAYLDSFTNLKIALKSNKILSSYIGKFLPKKWLSLYEGGIVSIDALVVEGDISDIKSVKYFFKGKGETLKGIAQDYPFYDLNFNFYGDNKNFQTSNLSAKVKNSLLKDFTIKVEENLIKGSGIVDLDFKDLPTFNKYLSFNHGRSKIFADDFEIPMDNITNLKLKGRYSVDNTKLSYDFFTDILVKNMKGSFTEKEVKVESGFARFRDIDYQLDGFVANYMDKVVIVDFNVMGNTFDKFWADNVIYWDISRCDNISAKINLKGELTDLLRLRLRGGDIKFNNSELTLYGHKFYNINGKGSLKNDTLYIDNLTFGYNGGRYTAEGRVCKIFDNHTLDLYMQGDTLDEYIGDLIDIGRLENLEIATNLGGSFDNILVKTGEVKLKGSALKYDNYSIKDIVGTIKYSKETATLQDIKCTLDNISYNINGQITTPFISPDFSVNVRSNSIDSLFLKDINLNIDTVKNVDADLNIIGNLTNLKKITFHNSNIKFLSSDILFLKSGNVINSLKGEIAINNDKVSFNNIHGDFDKGFLSLGGYLYLDKVKKGYFEVSGKNFTINSSKLQRGEKGKVDSKKNTVDNISDKEREGNIAKNLWLKNLHKTLQGLDITFDFKFDNISTEVNNYSNIIFNSMLNSKGIKINRGKITASDTGYLNISNGELLFDGENHFILEGTYSGINIGDIMNFLIPKTFEFYGLSESSYFNIGSRFNDFNDFYKNMNGSFNINFKDGFVNRGAFFGSIFSILNVSQIFEFKFPDINTEGFKYQKMKGDFQIKNGVISTENLKLKSNAFDIIYIGQIDLDNKTIDSTLAVYPLKTVDKIIKWIPIVNYLFTDKKGKKAILVTYLAVTGKLDDPDIKIKPIKSITNKIGSILKNIINIPGEVFTNPGNVISPEKDQ